MSTSNPDPLKTYVASRFLAVEDAFKKKYAAAKAEEEALKKRSLAFFVFESLMESAKNGRLQEPERAKADPCTCCKGATVVMRRTEDTSVMFGGLSYDAVTYIVCFACCTARQSRGSRTDASGSHYG